MSNYNVITTTRKALPRSKRLRASGHSVSANVVNISGGGGGGTPVGDGHTHANKAALDAISVDNSFYMWLRQKLADADDSTLQKIKAGFADNAGQWNSHDFADYLNQPLRTTDFVTFAKVISDIIQSPGFVEGIETGNGWKIDAGGNGEMNSLSLRSFLKVPQLIYNKIRVTGGEMWNTEGGVIKAVTADPGSGSAFTLEMELEDNEIIELDVDDICKGHYNTSGGFITSYFRVTAVDNAAGTIRIVLGSDAAVPGGINHAPVANMNIARYGNFDTAKKDRQRSQYFSSSEQSICLLSGVDNYAITQYNYFGVFGKVPRALVPANLPIAEDDVSIYVKNVIAQNFFQVDTNSEIVKTIRDRGLWNLADATGANPYLCNASYQDDVYHLSCKWRCLVTGTTDEPSYDSPSWLLIAGDSTIKMAIDSTSGDTFLQGQLSTTLTAIVKKGEVDITTQILPSDWQWRRVTGNAVEDAAWNADHSQCTNAVSLTDEDMNGLSGLFECTAFVRDGAGVSSIAESIPF